GLRKGPLDDQLTYFGKAEAADLRRDWLLAVPTPRICSSSSSPGATARGSMLIASGANGEPCSGDAVVATAILDRMHHSHVITIRGDSYRLRENRSSGLL